MKKTLGAVGILVVLVGLASLILHNKSAMIIVDGCECKNKDTGGPTISIHVPVNSSDFPIDDDRKVICVKTGSSITWKSSATNKPSSWLVDFTRNQPSPVVPGQVTPDASGVGTGKVIAAAGRCYDYALTVDRIPYDPKIIVMPTGDGFIHKLRFWK